MRGAQALQGTDQAQRRSVGQADGGAQLHHGLVEVAGGLRGNDCVERALNLRAYGGLSHVAVPCGQPGVDAQHVSVHHGLRLPERDRGDGAGRVVADALELFQLEIGARHFASVFLDDGTRCGLQVACAAVIAQSFPQLHESVVRAGCQRPDIGKRLQKARIIVLDRLDARLLKHDLGNPDAVGILRAPPGQIALVRRVPVEQGFYDCLKIFHNPDYTIFRLCSPSVFPFRAQKPSAAHTMK